MEWTASGLGIDCGASLRRDRGSGSGAQEPETGPITFVDDFGAHPVKLGTTWPGAGRLIRS
jgi:hypothetical protein